MNLIQRRIQRDAGGSADNCGRGVTGGVAVRRRDTYPGAVVTAIDGPCGVAEGTIVAGGMGGIMMDGAGRVGRGRMTDQAAICHKLLEQGAAIGTSPQGATASRIDVAESAVVIVYGGDGIGTWVAAGVAAFRVIREISGRMAAMGGGAIRMAIKAAYRQGICLDNGLNAGVAAPDIKRPVRVMAHGAAIAVQGIDAGCAAKGIGELSGRHAADAVASRTGSPTREVTGSHQHAMGGGRVQAMGIKTCEVVVAGIALPTSQMTGSVSLERSRVKGMAGITVGMGLSAANKWRGGGDMAAGRGAIDGYRHKDRVRLDRRRVTGMGMLGEIGAMAVEAGPAAVIARRHAASRHKDDLAPGVGETVAQWTARQVTGGAGIMDLVV